jgi:hypothetical protein
MPAVESRRRNSFLGSIALFTGLPALALAWFDFTGFPKVQVGPFELRFVEAIGAAALLLAILSLLLASASKRTGTEIPLAAVVVCAAALGLAHFRHATPAPPALPAPGSTPPAAKASAPATTSQSKTPQNRPPGATSAVQAVNTAKTVPQTNAQALQQQQVLAALHQARTNYDDARAAVIKSLETDPAYQNAKSDADAADEQLKQARLTLPPGHPELARMSQDDLKARDKLNQLIDDAMLKDPVSRQAITQLNAAQDAARH